MTIVIWFCLLMSLITGGSSETAQYWCPNTTSYSPNSTYKANLDSLLSNLYSNATRDNGFYHTTVGRSGSNDTVHGLFLCRGDVSTDVCRNCVGDISKRVLEDCTNGTTAVIWFENCMLRYSEKPMLGILDQSCYLSLKNDNNDTQPNAYMQLVGSMLEQILTRASSSGSNKKFAVQVANFSVFETVYALGQCTPDLSNVDCQICFRKIIAILPGFCYGAQGNKGKSSAKVIIIIIAAASVVSVTAILLSALCFYFLKMKRATKSHSDVKETTSAMAEIPSDESVQYDFSTIKAITNCFSSANKIGEGGYGAVYKGRFPSGQEVAVKRLSRTSTQGAVEFKNEVALVAKLLHRNLVKLLGGYMSPEYVMHGSFSVKSDVFSFGVLLLEIITGKRNNSLSMRSTGAKDLLSYAWKHWREDRALDMVDQSLGGLYSRNEVIQCINVGLLCVQEEVDERPTMANVVLMLNSFPATRRALNPPAFFSGGIDEKRDENISARQETDQSESKSLPLSVNEVSTSDLYPR
nr:cysteine-rich receptor-like protein kinase 25 [Ipomoea batatas]